MADRRAAAPVDTGPDEAAKEGSRGTWKGVRLASSVAWNTKPFFLEKRQGVNEDSIVKELKFAKLEVDQ